MSDRSRFSVPSYRLHKQSGQAIVTLGDGLGGRRDVLLGPHGTADSRREYARVIAQWEANGRRLPAASAVGDVTVNELILACWRFAEGHYRQADGTPTNELNEYRQSLKPLRELYGPTPAREFGPLALKAVRRRMVDAGLCRPLVNRRVGRDRRAFKWVASEEMIPAATFQALQTVAGLARGRTEAREPAPVGPVPDAHVEAVLPHLLPEVRAMVELQRLTGMRPGEVCSLQFCDLDTASPVWLYRPRQHKTAWRGKDRVVTLGPKAQAVVRPFLPANANEYVFSPARAMAARRERRRSARRSKVQPSQADRRTPAPKVRAGDRYSACSYGYAVRRAYGRAGIPTWSPNRLRHACATEVRRRYGLEAAQAVLGHARADVTQVYAERDLALAGRVAAEIG